MSPYSNEYLANTGVNRYLFENNSFRIFPLQVWAIIAVILTRPSRPPPESSAQQINLERTQTEAAYHRRSCVGGKRTANRVKTRVNQLQAPTESPNSKGVEWWW